jgi:hypothetical protein
MAASRTVNLRQAVGLLILLKPRTNWEVRIKFFSVSVMDDWNAIPLEMKMVKNPYQ